MEKKKKPVIPSGSSRRVTPKSLSATPKACSRFSRLVCWYTLPMSISLGLEEQNSAQLVTKDFYGRSLKVSIGNNKKKWLLWVHIAVGPLCWKKMKASDFHVQWIPDAQVLLSLYFKHQKPNKTWELVKKMPTDTDIYTSVHKYRTLWDKLGSSNCFYITGKPACLPSDMYGHLPFYSLGGI